MSSSSRELEKLKLMEEKSETPMSPDPPSSSSDKRDLTSCFHRGRPPIDYVGGNHSNNSNASCRTRDYEFEYGYESPTEAPSTSSFASFPNDDNNSTSDSISSSRIEKDHLRQHIDPKGESKRSDKMREKRTPGVLPSEVNTMIEMTKITALVRKELQSQRDRHNGRLNQTVAKFKEQLEKLQKENDHLRDRLRNDHPEDQTTVFKELQGERDALIDEVARRQQKEQKTKDELGEVKARVRKDSAKRLSIMDSMSTSWESGRKEAKQKEDLLNSELDVMSKTLKYNQELLGGKSMEFAQLEALYRSTKTELLSIKMTTAAKQEEMDTETKRQCESHKLVCEEHEHILKLKNDKIYLAETSIRIMKAELQSTRKKFRSTKELMALMKEDTKKRIDKSGVVDSAANALRKENSRQQAEIKELQSRVGSYLASMALQKQFSDSLKSRIYNKQDNDQEHVYEIHELRKRIKKQKQKAVEKDLQMDELKQLLGDSSSSSLKGQSKSSRKIIAAVKKSSLKLPLVRR